LDIFFCGCNPFLRVEFLITREFEGEGREDVDGKRERKCIKHFLASTLFSLLLFSVAFLFTASGDTMEPPVV